VPSCVDLFEHCRAFGVTLDTKVARDSHGVWPTAVRNDDSKLLSPCLRCSVRVLQEIDADTLKNRDGEAMTVPLRLTNG